VNIEEVENAKTYIFLQPNKFNKETFNTHGILENNMIYAMNKKKSASY